MTKTAFTICEGSAPRDGQPRVRLQEIGAQAARVVHELKVPLSMIDGSLQSLEQHASAATQYMRMATAPESDVEGLAARRTALDLEYLSEQAPALFDICRDGVRRLHVLIEQLGDYARGVQPTVPRTIIKLGDLLREATVMAACGRAVLPTIHAELGVEQVYGDAHALSRAFINLIANAFDAVADVGSACVWLTMVSIEPRFANRPAVEVQVRDNGPGVPSGMEARIFRPFVSTKSGRSGLGLGLAIAKTIVEQHGGTITLSVHRTAFEADRQLERGAEFVVRLPAIVEP
jgi:signal transduction histidine kinase